MSTEKRPLDCPWYEKLWRFVMHLPIGYIAAWPGGVSLAVLFVVYELSQDRYKKDGAFIDIIGAVFGAAGGVIVRWFG